MDSANLTTIILSSRIYPYFIQLFIVILDRQSFDLTVLFLKFLRRYHEG